MPLIALADNMNYEFPVGMYDVRDWDVITLVDHERVGHVHDLLIDEAGKPRYLDIDLGLLRKHVLLPIGQAHADPAKRVIWIPGFTREQFREIPAYAHDLTGLTREYENGLVVAYSSAYAGERYRPRPAYAGAVYGPSELETRVRIGELPRVALLSHLDDVRIASGEPDPRGWIVTTADDRRVGVVRDLIIDTLAMKVRYLVCEVDTAAVGLPEDHPEVLIPVGYAALDERGRAVRVEAISAHSLQGLPVLSGDEIWRELEEEAIRRDGQSSDDRRFYDHPRFDPHRFFGRPRR